MKDSNVFEILERTKVGCSFLNCDLYDEFSKTMDNEDDIIKKIKKYNTYRENNNNKYSENIMMYLRQRNELNKYDFSKDEEFNKLSPNEVFQNIVTWNGLLGGYHEKIKSWVKDIYGIDLNEIKEKVL